MGLHEMWVAVALLCCWFGAGIEAQGDVRSKLSTQFYDRTCPRVEQVVASTMFRHLQQDITSGAPLLRMFFHDCAVNGCDGSVLIASTPGNLAERDAVPNLTVRGYEIVDDIKSQMEAMCPGVVSCADILALASRDAVVQAGGPMWTVELGRRDGRVSSAEQAASLLPSSQSTADSLITQFAALGLSPRDMATLSEAKSPSDSSLLVNVKTGRYVTEYAGNRDVFFERFAAAMLKMGRVGVKLGSDGEIRRVCSAVN